MDEEMLLEEAAARARLNADHLRRLCRQGKIEARKIGRDWLVSWPSLRAYVVKWHPERELPEGKEEVLWKTK